MRSKKTFTAFYKHFSKLLYIAVRVIIAETFFTLLQCLVHNYAYKVFSELPTIWRIIYSPFKSLRCTYFGIHKLIEINNKNIILTVMYSSKRCFQLSDRSIRWFHCSDNLDTSRLMLRVNSRFCSSFDKYRESLSNTINANSKNENRVKE